MKQGLIAFALAFAIMASGASAMLPESIQTESDLQLIARDWSGTSAELISALEYACNNHEGVPDAYPNSTIKGVYTQQKYGTILINSTTWERANATSFRCSIETLEYVNPVERCWTFRSGREWCKTYYSARHTVMSAWYVYGIGVDEIVKNPSIIYYNKASDGVTFHLPEGLDLPTNNDWCDQSDIDMNGSVGQDDLEVMKANFGRRDCSVGNNWCERSDIDRNGMVAIYDFMLLKRNWGRTGCFGI